MDKETFIAQFVVNFLASYCANKYEFACSHDRHEILWNPPVDDAYNMAESAWERNQEYLEREQKRQEYLEQAAAEQK